MRTVLLAFATLVLATATASAGRKQVKYIGIHPVPRAEGGGFCHIEGAHVHVFGADKLQYRDHRGHHHFVGDPVAYGYDGPRHAYKGHHPIQVNAVVGTPEVDTEFCYLDGSHYHYFAPPPGPDFKVVGDVSFYVGTPPAAYIEARPAYVGINATYKPIVYARPVVEVEPPIGWIGAHVDVVGPGVVVEAPHARVIAPRAHVVTPGVAVDVHIPTPTLQVEFGIGGGVVHHRHRGHGKHKKFKRGKHKRRGRW